MNLSEQNKIKKISKENFETLSEKNGRIWKVYHDNTKSREPRDVLVEFLSSHKGEFNSALDLGCGAFADSVYIAKQGIPVMGIDLSINRNILNEHYLQGDNSVKQNLHAQAQDLAHLRLPKVDFIYSFAALPFCPEANYVNMILNIAKSVNPDGYLALHFFEKKHPFVKRGGARGFSSKQLEDSFNYLGFTNTETTQWQSLTTQNGDRLPNLNNIFLTAKAPEHLSEYSRDTLQQYLGIKREQSPMDSSTILGGILSYKNIHETLDSFPFNQLDTSLSSYQSQQDNPHLIEDILNTHIKNEEVKLEDELSTPLHFGEEQDLSEAETLSIQQKLDPLINQQIDLPMQNPQITPPQDNLEQ